MHVDTAVQRINCSLTSANGYLLRSTPLLSTKIRLINKCKLATVRKLKADVLRPVAFRTMPVIG